jgi:hypothetical protein
VNAGSVPSPAPQNTHILIAWEEVIENEDVISLGWVWMVLSDDGIVDCDR